MNIKWVSPPFIVKLWQENAFGIKKIYTSEAKGGSAFSLTSGKLYEINNGATPVFRVDAKIVIE